MTASDAVIDAAVEYANRGWSVLPLKGKRPAVHAWRCRQTDRASPAEAMAWFRRVRSAEGVGVVLGAVSGHLAVRDFDEASAYRAWAEAHPDLAAALPTVQTARGFHVYFRSQGVATRALADGELRGEGSYVVAPPSPHPSGKTYSWMIPLPGGPIPEVDPQSGGLDRAWAVETRPMSATESTERTERTESPETTEPPETTEETENTEAMGEGWSDETRAAIQSAVNRTMPHAVGNRNRHVFKFCRALKAIPQLARINRSGVRALKPIVREWHQRALARGTIQTRNFGTTWADFVVAWDRVRTPEGDDVVARAAQRAEDAAPPLWASDYADSPPMLLLAKLCRELQRIMGSDVFFLSSRTAAAITEVHHTTVCRWLQAFVADGALIEVRKGNESGLATRWRYVANDLHESK